MTSSPFPSRHQALFCCGCIFLAGQSLAPEQLHTKRLHSSSSPTPPTPPVPTLAPAAAMKIGNVYSVLGFVGTARIHRKRVVRARAPAGRFLGCVWETERYLYDLLRLGTLVEFVYLSAAIFLVISDVDGELSGLQLLEAVRLAAAPDEDVLHQDKNRLMRTQTVEGRGESAYVWTAGAHHAVVDNKTVPLVEAGPASFLLRCPDGPATLDVQQALHVRRVSLHMFKARSHAPHLEQKKPSFKGGSIHWRMCRVF